MKLSICIPTFNRIEYLANNVLQLIEQIRKFKYEDLVEINISNNGSTDNTVDVIRNIIDNNRDITIHLFSFSDNQGPDVNFISAMNMAKYEYSILLGDDDFIKENRLNYIIDTINKNPEIFLFLTNRSEIDGKGNYIGERVFLKQGIENRIFDFSKDNDASAFFASSIEFAGCLCFISSVIYKTETLKENPKYDGSFNGSFYAFWYYWWNSLARGKKLLYIKTSFVNCTTIGSTNSHYGLGLSRLFVEYKGFSLLVDKVFANKDYKDIIYDVPKRLINYPTLIGAYMRASKRDKCELFPILDKCGWSSNELSNLKKMLSVRYNLFNAFRSIFPWIQH